MPTATTTSPAAKAELGARAPGSTCPSRITATIEEPVFVRYMPSPIVAADRRGIAASSSIHSIARPSISCWTAATASVTRLAPSSSDTVRVSAADRAQEGRAGIGIVGVVDQDLAATVVMDEHADVGRRPSVVNSWRTPDAGKLGLAHVGHGAIVAVRPSAPASSGGAEHLASASAGHHYCAEPMSDGVRQQHGMTRLDTPVDIKPRSRDVTDGMQKAPSRAMLRAVGMGDADWDKPQVAIASSWNEVTPCNMTLRKLAEHAKVGVREAGGFPLEFGTITVSDGISMGHEGMRASLVSREVICDSVETVMHAERFDGFVGLAGCDKSIPGMLMAAARLDLASVFVYNGSIMPGEHNGVALDITSVFEAVGACAAGTIDRGRTPRDRGNACPGEGACGGMFTANTMSSIAEALGMSLPGTASPPAIDGRREGDAERAGEAVVNLLRLGITPRQIMTKPAFENAIALTSALGGSTNAVLHLLAIANEAGVELDLDDFNRIADKVPHIADMKPGGKFHMSDLDRVGGVPVGARSTCSTPVCSTAT